MSGEPRLVRRLVLSAGLLGGLLGGPAMANAQTSDARVKIERVIAAQIEAFRRDDGGAAYGFATPALQKQFGDAAHFFQMVKAAYPIVVRPASFSFGELSPDGRDLEQKVEFVGPNGETALAVYDMAPQGDGGWRIAGCALMKSERIAT